MWWNEVKPWNEAKEVEPGIKVSRGVRMSFEWYPSSSSCREAAQRGNYRDTDLTQSLPMYHQQQQQQPPQPQNYLVPLSMHDPTQSLPINAMGHVPEQQNGTGDHAVKRSSKSYSHDPRPHAHPQRQKTPTFSEIREPVDGPFAAAMSAQHRPKPAPRRTQPNHPEQLQGQRYPSPPQPSQPGTNGHYDRPPPNPRPSYPDGQQYMPLLPTKPRDPEDNQYVVISDRPQPQVLPSPGTMAQPQGNYTPLQPTSSPADEDNGYMVLVSASTRPQPRPRPAPRQQRQQPEEPHYSVLEGPTSSDHHAPPTASNRFQSLTDAQRNYVAPDSPGAVTETIEEHEYVDPDTMDRGITNTSSPPVDSRNYVEANRAPMIGEHNYVEPDSNPAVGEHNYVEPDSNPLVVRGNGVGSHPGPPVAPRIHDDFLSPVDDRNYVFQEAIGSQPRPQPRLAPPSPRRRSGKLAAPSGTQGADVYKMIENFSPSQVDMLMQMLQKVQVQTQTQTREDVEAAWDTSPENPLSDSRAPGTNQRNLRKWVVSIQTPAFQLGMRLMRAADPTVGSGLASSCDHLHYLV